MAAASAQEIETEEEEEEEEEAETKVLHVALPTGQHHHEEEEVQLRFPMDGHEVVVPVTLHARLNVADTARALVDEHHLPQYLEPSVVSLLQSAMETFQQKALDARDDKLAEAAAGKTDSMIDILAQWRAAYSAEWAHYRLADHLQATERFESSFGAAAPEPDFHEVFHEAIHSELLQPLLEMETAMSDNIAEMIHDRDRALQKSEEEHASQLQRLMDRLGDDVTDRDINATASRHVYEREMHVANLESEIRAQRLAQKQGYQDYVRELHRDMKQGKLPAPASRPSPLSPQTSPQPTRRDTTGSVGGRGNKNLFNSVLKFGRSVGNVLKPGGPGSPVGDEPRASMEFASEESHVQAPPVIESFTVVLGTQMKIVHNLRLMSALSALVLPVDQKLSSHTGQKRRFASVCEQVRRRTMDPVSLCVLLIMLHVATTARKLAADLHFEELDEQIETLRDDMMASRVSKPSSPVRGGDILLKPGDCYITRHSNLADTHVAFHLVVNDDVLSTQLNTQHRIMTGLRNIFRSVFQNNINTLTLPLFLTLDLPEAADRRWMLQRAELVLKTIKGYIMENTAWGRMESKTIQLVLPQGHVDEMAHVASLVESIFRQTRAV
ncbi:uncharacterized protein MONBRDRAFT_25304 [Monosiga brevicollis MX1]|uniref:Uncharacterized protein n=1 Tax=Monosiga brevicollis TaxID=81824 RepID=A9UZ09_MONBE|nr:uncharacterized protein MONBRDRAFT_25304 [Monosiga brevicollis MX1]EDQ89702.1 predicted protein [Monosiga brevicollis MX1]|eukprot:XP_001745731.1 hypothetical protein [Monosiga brevicollis MX1]